MAFLLITESIENTIKSLSSDKEMCEKVYKQTGNEVYRIKAKDYADKLDAALRYARLEEKRTSYQRIRHLKFKNLPLYISKCSQICKGLPGVYFDEKRLLFRVQITRGGKRMYLGQFDTPDDALEILKTRI